VFKQQKEEGIPPIVRILLRIAGGANMLAW